MNQILIVGAGRFGRKAIAAMKMHYPKAALTVVDHCPKACEAIFEPALTAVCMDGISCLNQKLTAGEEPDWIIPVIPVHLAFEWIRQRLSPAVIEPVDVPESFLEALPNGFPGNAGEVFVSYATFVCPENCSEPMGLCTQTRLPRLQPLHLRIASLPASGFLNLVIPSQQLAPGIGGISTRVLKNTLSEVQAFSGPILLSTACKCHGVVQAFQKKFPTYPYPEI